MKAVILAAGEGTRMRPLTRDTPKPLLPVAGKPIIQHNIDLIKDRVDEIIVVVGYRKEQFEEYFSGTDITIVEQQEALGTAHAALQTKDHIDDQALVLNGDDIYGEGIIEAASNGNSVLAGRADDPENYGVFRVSQGEVEGIVEKPEEPPSDLINIGCYSVGKEFFELLEDVEKSERGEYEITDALDSYMKDESVEVVEAERWLPCSYPWQLLNANEELISEVVEKSIEGQVSEEAVIEGPVVVEEGATVRENSVIEGPAIIKSGATVGPQAYIRHGSVMGENVHVGNAEVKNSVIREDSKVPHYSYIGDSYIGKKVNIGAGAKTANLRNDSSGVKMEVKGEMLETGREKLGAFIGSRAKVGINNSIKPGRKIGYRAVTDSGEKVGRNVPDRSLLKDGEIIEDRN